ncbi:double C2-like domain-containing protein beta isoform X2 [Artemia franciscana]|uniref:double C2-like domain-containing protein beta isoform X2 n=1 Tax=Artemia franciscana TaxID=6661 RepID=UPI0032DBE948
MMDQIVLTKIKLKLSQKALSKVHIIQDIPSILLEGSQRSKEDEDANIPKREVSPRKNLKDLKLIHQSSLPVAAPDKLRLSPSKPTEINVVTVTSANEEDTVIYVTNRQPGATTDLAEEKTKYTKKQSILARSRALFSRRNSSFGKSQDSESNYSYSSTIAKSFESLASPEQNQNESKRFGSLSTNSSQSQSSVEKSPAPSTRSLNVCSSCPSSRTNSSEDDQVEGSYGKLELTTHYDIQKHALHCIVMRARGLRATDINGLADPYCLLILEKGSEISDYRLRTSTVQKTVNPEFSETVTFFNVEAEDIETKTLHLAVMDDDRFGYEVLGELRLPLSVLQNLYSRHFTLPLEKPTTSMSRLVEAWRNRGSILLSLLYSRGRETMIVTILKCKDLSAMDSNGYSDPYVKIQIRPDPHQRKFKTSIKWKTLNPEFNEEFSFKTKITDLPKQRLEIAVWDKDIGKSDDYIGGVMLSLSSKGERLRHWLDALKFPDKNHERWHHLSADVVFE